MLKALTHGHIFTGERWLEDHAVVIDKDTIVDVCPTDQLDRSIDIEKDLQGNTLIPGFIDLQVNGGGGIMFNNAPTVETLKVMSEAHGKFGTTGFMPTLITTSYEVMAQAIAAVEQAINAGVPGVLGIHLEGPFLNSRKKGAHDDNHFRALDAEGIELITSLKNGKVIATIAPELCDDNSIQLLSEAGVILCAGHSNATYEETLRALSLGVNGFTHLFNAMTQFGSREPGMVGAALDDKDSWFGIIADGYHCHPTSLRVAVNSKNQGGAILVTDAMATVGSDKDYFVLDSETIYSKEGRCTNAAGNLAGSDLDMLSAVNNTCEFACVDWEEAVRMASAYPAKALEGQDYLGSIKPGYRASFLEMANRATIVSRWVDGNCFS